MSDFRIIGYDEKGAAIYLKSPTVDIQQPPVDLSEINEDRKQDIRDKFKQAYQRMRN